MQTTRKTAVQGARQVFAAALLLLAALPVIGAQRTASVSVGATVMASCRIIASAQALSPLGALRSHQSECAGSTRPATHAVLENGRPQQVAALSSDKFSVESPDGTRSAWIRLDVIY